MLFNNVSANLSTSSLRSLIAWVTGLSLSTIVLLLILFISSIILRRKGYGVRLGLTCIIFYAKPGSRRFPDGVEVRLTTRFVGFFFGGFQGPLIDIYADRFYMRLRPSTSPSSTNALPRRSSVSILRFIQSSVAAVDRSHWSTFMRNVAARLFAYVIRFLRVRVEKVRIWKDGGSYDLNVEQFVLSGHAYNIIGCKYKFSVNELFLNVITQPVNVPCTFKPIKTTFGLQCGIEIEAHLGTNLFAVLRHRRFVILDDLTISLKAARISAFSSKILQATIADLNINFSPGRSRSLLAKLPSVAPLARQVHTPGLLQYWEGSVGVNGISFRFNYPSELPSCSSDFRSSSSIDLSKPSVSDDIPPLETTSDMGLFLRLDNLRFDAYGKTKEERRDPMIRASLAIHGCSAGSSSVDMLSQELYEDAPVSFDNNVNNSSAHNVPGAVESVENIDKLVAAKPEILVWIEDTSFALDMNCATYYATRVDVGGTGGVFAIEPVGLVILISELSNLIGKYWNRKQRPQHVSLQDDNDSLSSLSRTGSSSSLPSLSTEPDSVRMTCDLRYWTALVLGRGTVGDGDTLAVIASCQTAVISQVDVLDSSLLRLDGYLKNFELDHWSGWNRTKNVRCESAIFDIQRQGVGEKKVELSNTTIDWDLDMHSGLEMLPSLLSTLKDLKTSNSALKAFDNSNNAVWVPPPPQPSPDFPEKVLSAAEQQERRDMRRKKTLNSLSSWHVTGHNISVGVAFPDGPKLRIDVAELPKFKLSTETFVGHHVVVTLQEHQCAYAAEFRMGSPLHTMSKNIEKRSIDVDIRSLTVVLGNEEQFGFLLQDWLLRLRSAIRILRELKWERRGLTSPQVKKRPMADIHFKCSDAQVFFEDHPISAFLTRTLPLMQDEAHERVKRDDVMAKLQARLNNIQRAKIAGTSSRCAEALKVRDSEIWTERVKMLKEVTAPRKIGNGYLPDMAEPPAVSFIATTFSFDVILDDHVREMGSKESIRRMKMLDDYELGSKKYNKTRQYDRDAWNSIGFRTVEFEATGVSVQLRDYPYPFLIIDRMYFDNTTMGQAVQATTAPYVCETMIAIGKRRLAKVQKTLAPTKSFCDIHLKVDTLHCHFNPAYLAGIADFGRGISRFFSGGKNPSPRIPWFDSLRVNMHGRMRLTAKKFTGALTSSTSPYSSTDHYLEIESDNFEMLTSRLQPTKNDPFPICWKFQNWHIRPSSFNPKRRSEIILDVVRVGLNPTFSVGSDDPQDHYFVPFPTKEEVAQGGPGIGRGTTTLLRSKEPIEPKDDGFGTYTQWWSGLHETPGFDSFVDFKTQSMILGFDIFIRPAKAKPRSGQRRGNHRSEVASVLYSDAISTLSKVVNSLVSRPISCRLPPRRVCFLRKPPSKTGFTTSLRGLDINVDAKDLNLMMHNNLEPGHGLYLSVDSIKGELWKRTDVSIAENGDINRTSRITRRWLDIVDIYSSIQAPDLDMAVDSDNMGKLLTVDKISLSDNHQDELKYMASPRKGGRSAPSSGFGTEDLDESPFYTFSTTHPLQRGNRLDKVQYDKSLLVDGVRLIWSPVRRISMFAWPDAFKVKSFCMKAPRSGNSDKTKQGDESKGDSLLFPDENVRAGGTNPKESSSSVLEDPGDEQDGRNNSTSADGIPDLRNFLGRVSRELSNDSERTGTIDISVDDTDTQSGRIETNSSDPRKSSSWVSSPTLPLTRSKAIVKRKHVGSMVDLLASYESSQSSSDKHGGLQEASVPEQKGASALDTFKPRPKFALYINDCEVVFGSPETSGHVFLRSKAVRVGILDKKVQKRIGSTIDSWIDREYRFHLDAAEVFTRDKAKGKFDFNSRNWSQHNLENKTLSLLTKAPISMDLLYVTSSSLPSEDQPEEVDEHSLRPSLLFINVPQIRLSTNACEFHAMTDVVRKVLMQSMRSSEIVTEELSNLRYNLQLSGGKISSKELEEYTRQLTTITRQFLYAGDTSQPHLVEQLMLPNEKTFSDTLQRYKAKAKAVATFLRKDQRAMTADVLYPTMYISYSFDQLSWELRESRKELNKEVEDAFVSIALENLVCRHIFYVGRGSSTEITFQNIYAQNKMQYSYFKRILQPAGSSGQCGVGGSEKPKSCGIKASDGATVAFRWYSTQEDRVGGIPVYELLTIQVAPMIAAVTRKLYTSVSDFIFVSTRTRANGETEAYSHENQDRRVIGLPRAGSKHTDASTESMSRTGSSDTTSLVGKRNGNGNGNGKSTHLDDVSQMAKRGESTILFKYIFIDAFELTASYKNKDTENRGALDVFDLFVRTPSFSYSSEVWTWKAFSVQIRKDLITTFFVRGATSLAKLKLLPGYSRARRRLAQGADTVREKFYNPFPTGSHSSDPVIGEKTQGERDVQNALTEDGEMNNNMTEDIDDHENAEEKLDAAMVDIGGAAEPEKRERVLKALYGNNAHGGKSSHGPQNTKLITMNHETSSQSSGFRARARALAGGRSRAGSRTSSRSPGSEDGEKKKGLFRRLRRRANQENV